MKNLKFLIAGLLAMFSIAAFADDIDEAEAYKALMKQQLLSQQHAAQQAQMANTIESFQASKIARLKAQLAANQPQQPPQVVYVQPQQQAYSMTQQEAQQQVYSSSQYAYHGQTYNVHPLQPMTPLQRSVIPDTPPAPSQQPQLTPDNRLVVPQGEDQDENGMTPEEAAQEQWETEHMPRQPSQASDGDPLGLQPIRYRQRSGAAIQVRYMQSVTARQVRPQQVIYMQQQPQQRVVIQQPQQVQRVTYLSR